VTEGGIILSRPIRLAVSYEGLPVSAGGAHGMGKTGCRQALAKTQAFLDACAKTEGEPAARFIRMDHLPPDPALDSLIASRFGRARIQPVGPDLVDCALRTMQEITPQRLADGSTERYWLSFEWNFILLEPDDAGTASLRWPGREWFGSAVYSEGLPLGHSRATLSVHNRCRLALSLCLPPLEGESLARMAGWLQDRLPVRLSDRHWKEWTQTKSGGIKGRKIRIG